MGVFAPSWASASEEGVAPNIFAGDLGTSVFTLAIFIVLMLILGKWAWPPILSALQEREKHIQSDIKAAEEARIEAAQALEGNKKILAGAENKAREIVENSRNEAHKISLEIKTKTEQEVQTLRDRAKRDIEDARNQALQEIYNQTADLATDIAGQIIQRSLNPDDHRRLVSESIEALSRKIQQN